MSNLITLDFDESEKLIEQLRKPFPNRYPNHRNIRNHLMGLLMLDAGLRCGELTNLIVSDLLFEGEPVSYLNVRKETSKSKRERTVPLTKRVQDAIRNMLVVWTAQKRTYAVNWAFTTGNTPKRLSRRTVERIIKAAAIIAIARDIHPHVLRHTFASRLMRKTNIRVVQELLGHKSITSTQIYTHPNSVDLNEAIKAIENGEN